LLALRRAEPRQETSAPAAAEAPIWIAAVYMAEQPSSILFGQHPGHPALPIDRGDRCSLSGMPWNGCGTVARL